MDNTKQTIGNLFQIGFEGPEVSAQTEKIIREWKLSSFILFRRNYKSLDQLIALVQHLHRLTAPLPPFIAVDQEGGKVWRFGEPFTVLPGNDYLGRIASDGNSLRFASDAGNMVATELLAAGVNWNFAPVVDINTNPLNPVIGSRAFGDDAVKVARLAAAFTDGLQNAGVIASAKHFPGHGDTSIDSHIDLPRVNNPLDLIRRRELKPFRSAVRAGAASVMIGHMLIPQLDAELPTSLSRSAYQLLRQTLGYRPLAITDDLVMEAVARQPGTDRAAVMALSAGADVAMICHHPEMQIRALELAGKALESGELHPSRIAAASRRVETLRRTWLSRSEAPSLTQARRIIGSDTARQLRDRIAELGKPVNL